MMKVGDLVYLNNKLLSDGTPLGLLVDIKWNFIYNKYDYGVYCFENKQIFYYFKCALRKHDINDMITMIERKVEDDGE